MARIPWLGLLAAASSTALGHHRLIPLLHQQPFVCTTRRATVPAARLGGSVPPRRSRNNESESNAPGRGGLNELDLASEYERQLAVARDALAAAEHTRLNMQQQQKREQPPPTLSQELQETPLADTPPLELSGARATPAGLRCRVERSDAGTLLIEVPAAGLLNGGTLIGGAFSIAWFSAIIPATIASAASLPTLAFMAPFWLAGGAVAKTMLLDPALSSSLSIGKFAWSLREQIPLGKRFNIREIEGDTDELRGAEVVVSAYVNEVPILALQLERTSGQTSLCQGLARVELEFLADEINAQLEFIRDPGSSGLLRES